MIARASWVAAGALVALLSSPAVAAERGPGGTLGLAPSASWATPMTDEEMGELRGGFAGLAFSVFFSGTFDSLGNATGTLEVDTTGTFGTAPDPVVTVTDTEVQISTVIGDFQGASGIFQIASVPGSFNIVNNNLFIQIAIINVLNGAAIPTLQSLLGL